MEYFVLICTLLSITTSPLHAFEPFAEGRLLRRNTKLFSEAYMTDVFDIRYEIRNRLCGLNKADSVL